MRPVAAPPIPLEARYRTAAKAAKRMYVLLTVLSCVVGSVVSFLGTSATLSLQVAAYATKSYVTDAIKAHNEQPRAHDAAKSVHPELSAAADKLDRLVMDIGEDRKARRATDIALFQRFVSLEAASWEKDWRKRAASADAAVGEYRALVADPNVDPADAADRVLKSKRPPWLR